MRPLIRLVRVWCAAVLLTAGIALAQDGSVDFEAWNAVAQRAETALEADGASNEALEALRTEVSAYRDLLLVQSTRSDPRLGTLQSQLDALGPAPENGESEPEEIASRRAELLEQISRVTVAARQVEEAYSRAGGLVAEIDATIRGRQADELLRRGADPLNPTIWPQAAADFGASLDRLWGEIVTNWNSEVRRKETLNQLPAIGVLMLLALVLLTRGSAWARRGANWLRTRTRGGTGVWSTILSLGQIALPVIGIALIVNAGELSGLAGVRSTVLLLILPALAAVFFFVRWLAGQVFSSDGSVALLVLPRRMQVEARYYANVLSVLLVLRTAISTLNDIDPYTENTYVVLQFPILAFCGLVLFRLGQILRKTGVGDEPVQDDVSDASSVAFHVRVARLFGRGAMIIGVLGPVLAAFGYVALGDAIVFPAIMTLAVLGLVLVVQRFVMDLYHLVTGAEIDTNQSLVPVLSGITLSLLSLPLLALAWGARWADLTELWTRVQTGFSIGETRISPSDFMTFVVVFALGYGVTRLLQSGLRTSVLPKTRIDKGGQTAIVSGVGYVGIFLAAVIGITSAGIDLSSLAIVAGALSVGIGFGLQNIVSNFVSGIILLIERPISEGDWIEVGGTHGTVKDISVRSTRIETFDRFDVIIPNADLVSGRVSNYTRGNVLGRVIVPVGVAYGTDTRRVENLLMGIARDHPMVLMNPAPYVYFKGFGADSLDFEIRAVLRDVNQIISVKTEMNHLIAELFTREGIEIPFAQRDVWLRNPETLRSGDARPEGDTEESAP